MEGRIAVLFKNCIRILTYVVVQQSFFRDASTVTFGYRCDPQVWTR